MHAIKEPNLVGWAGGKSARFKGAIEEIEPTMHPKIKEPK